MGRVRVCLLEFMRPAIKFSKLAIYFINVVVKLVNSLRLKGLKHRQFIGLLEELNTSYFDVPYHNKIRWKMVTTGLRFILLK